MRSRILRDPAPTSEGGAVLVTTPAPLPAATASQPVAQAAAIVPPTVPLTVEEYQRLRDAERALGQLRQDQEAAAQKAENERLRLVADKDGAEKALTEQRAAYEARINEANQRHANLETSLLAEKKAGVIASALVGREFVSVEAGEQARLLLDSRFEVIKDASGQVVVRDKQSGQYAAQSIPALLDSPAYAHFLRPRAQGGAGASGTNHTPAAGGGPPAANPEQHFLDQVEARIGRQGAGSALAGINWNKN